MGTLASKKGIVITIAVLAGITGASFLAWLPGITGGTGQDGATFVITDHREYLDDVKKIHEVLSESTAVEFDKMLSGKTEPEQYMTSSEATSTQVAMQIREFVASKPPEEWQKSYILYGEALRSLNMYIGETQVVAGLMADGSDDAAVQIDELRAEADRLRAESSEYAALSDAARPLQ